MANSKKQPTQQQTEYQEFQQLLRSLGISSKYPQLPPDEQEQAQDLFSD